MNVNGNIIIDTNRWDVGKVGQLRRAKRWKTRRGGENRQEAGEGAGADDDS